MQGHFANGVDVWVAGGERIVYDHAAALADF